MHLTCKLDFSLLEARTPAGGSLQLRTSRPGLAPVSASFSRVITPLQKVAR
jgi:hypothetical protein